MSHTILLITMLSCFKVIYGEITTANKGHSFQYAVENLKSDTFVLDIPRIRGTDSYISTYRLTAKSTQRLELKPLTAGVDSMEIRIWLNYGGKQHCLRFFYERDVWQGELFTIRYMRPKDERSEWAMSKIIEKKAPKSGWENFLKTSIELNILDLPDCYTIPEYGYSTGFSSFVCFEISTKKSYRFYSYIEPNSFRKEIKEADDIERILNLIQSEFDFKMLASI
ncbi:MAG: hypothetical protein KF862_24625 [Chitinophagaceae bacterium]|nr:hypothetical protein [Chitinophagaceae bacterium]